VRLATAKIQNESHFVFAPPGEQTKFYRWSDYVNSFPVPEDLRKIRTLKEFVEYDGAALMHLKKDLGSFSKLPSIALQSKDFDLPFVPTTFRDFYCFEEHVQNARKNRGADMIPEWYEAPVFYYSNPLSFRGPSEAVAYPADSKAMDVELEIACVIGKTIRNANLQQAREAILGYSVLNDWTARDFQAWEMKMNMGPTKGKDFCTSFGSYIITSDELEGLRSGKGFDIEFELRINNEVFTKKNWKDIQFSFEEMIVRASKNCTMVAGEVIASGTMGLGCLLEHNIGKDPKRWLKIGDEVTMRWLPHGPELKNKIGEPLP